MSYAVAKPMPREVRRTPPCINVTMTWDEVTPESAAQGDTSDRGTQFEDEPLSFRELVDMIRAHGNPEFGGHLGSVYFSDEIVDYRTGTRTSYALHYSRNNPPSRRKWFDLAVRVAIGTAVKGTK